MSDWKLSDAAIVEWTLCHDKDGNTVYCFSEDDVKEFVQRLKKELCLLNETCVNSCLICKTIDELAGEALA